MHKNFPLPKNMKHYYPIQVGAVNKEKLLPLHDDIGNNISLKNNRYCELTALYWIWKNDLNSDYIGLCHYRRYYDFNVKDVNYPAECRYTYKYNNSFPNKVIEKINSSDIIPHLLSSYDIILPKPQKIEPNVEMQYRLCHSGEDLNILQNILLKKHPEYEYAWNAVMNGNNMSICNMFITNKEIFRAYSKWLFDILFEVENYIPPKQNLYQNRTFGFMSERLLNIYVNYNKYSVKYLPMIFLESKYSKIKRLSKKEIFLLINKIHS